MRSGYTTRRSNEARGLVEQIVRQDGGIGEDDALHRRVRDIALVPQRHVFEGRLDIGANHPRQAADLLAGDGVALVRHGRAALLSFGEVFLGLAHFGPLQMAHFQRDLLAQRRGQRQGGDERGMAVALDHL